MEEKNLKTKKPHVEESGALSTRQRDATRLLSRDHVGAGILLRARALSRARGPFPQLEGEVT